VSLPPFFYSLSRLRMDSYSTLNVETKEPMLP
jgi:hypothetical protein